MRVSKNKVAILSLAIAGLFASAAQAQVVLSGTGAGTGQVVYATEINLAAASSFLKAARWRTPLLRGRGAGRSSLCCSGLMSVMV